MNYSTNYVIQILKDSPILKILFELSEKIQLSDWYIAGGCVTQTLWNQKLGLDPLHGLKDIDIVYFNKHENSANEKEQRDKMAKLFSALPLPVDVINQARVHEWYPEKFGYSIPAYSSTEDGIATWIPAFSLGVRPHSNAFHVTAPFGLNDALEMIVRPNKRQITEGIYNKMVARLLRDWPTIKIVPWN